ncbi:unnamed protein product [Lupinus luteus]|uniref:Uncharacterized protein n=1 Tax=Lupinus luteus TaxID=3873 RepID=A0AAV1WIN0_LUPLU
MLAFKIRRDIVIYVLSFNFHGKLLYWQGMHVDSHLVVPTCYLRSLLHHQQGLINEFHIPERADQTSIEFQSSWRFGNGMFALILSFGLLLTALKSRKARSSRYGSGCLRGLIADYGVPLMILSCCELNVIPSFDFLKKIDMFNV